MKTFFMGGGKYAGLLCDMFAKDIDITGYFDDVSPESYIMQRYGIKYLGKSTEAATLRNDCPKVMIAIGSEGDLSARIKHFFHFKSAGFTFPVLKHASGYVSPSSAIGQGTVLQYNTLVHPYVAIGENCVISSSAIIGHDSVIGDNVYVGPGVIVNGSVTIGDGSFLGTGSIVIQKKRIGKNCVVAAAACVISDIPDNSVVTGVPGKIRARA
jgi:sugar O-acyltransferase (sialic acid O-acetyltransferase NeuD family)